MEKLPIIFRKHEVSTGAWEVTAFFPTLPADTAGKYLTCYAHIGQHSGAAPEYFAEGAACAPDEYADLLAELAGIYDDVALDVCEAITPDMHDAFRANLQNTA